MKKGVEKSKSGQVTIFIIVGIIIIAAGILIYLFYPQLKTSFGSETKSPSMYMQDCLQGEVENSVNTLLIQGGSINPGTYILYKNQKINYLCYTNEYYKPCVMQEPDLVGKLQTEIYNSIKPTADMCFDSMKKSYQNAGYDVSANKGDMIVEILPKRIVVSFNSSVVLTRGETQKFDGFSVVLNNNLYELSSIASSILNWETRYGDVETTTYMTFYRDLKVEKYQQTDGSKVFILTNRDTGNKFQFATRTYAFPGGI